MRESGTLRCGGSIVLGKYRKAPLISPGLMQLRKGFWRVGGVNIGGNLSAAKIAFL